MAQLRFKSSSTSFKAYTLSSYSLLQKILTECMLYMSGTLLDAEKKVVTRKFLTSVGLSRRHKQQKIKKISDKNKYICAKHYSTGTRMPPGNGAWLSQMVLPDITGSTSSCRDVSLMVYCPPLSPP